jgi:hypothetical protein
VPRAYGIFRVYEGIEGENKSKEIKNRKCNIKKQNTRLQKYYFFKKKEIPLQAYL